MVQNAEGTEISGFIIGMFHNERADNKHDPHAIFVIEDNCPSRGPPTDFKWPVRAC